RAARALHEARHVVVNVAHAHLDRGRAAHAVLTYRILGRGGGAEMFTINPSTGTISVARSGLDRELTDGYTLVVEARGGGGMRRNDTGQVRRADGSYSA